MRQQQQQWATTCMLIVVNSLEDRKHSYTLETAKRREREQLSPADVRSQFGFSGTLYPICIDETSSSGDKTTKYTSEKRKITFCSSFC